MRPVRFPPCATGARPTIKECRRRVAEARYRPAPVLCRLKGDQIYQVQEPFQLFIASEIVAVYKLND